MNNELSNARRFLNAFSTIESVFKSWNETGESMGFSNYVHRYSRMNNIIKQYRDDLLEYSQLRNAIVHDRAQDNQIIAQPHESVVIEIEKIAKLLTNPPLLKELSLKTLVVCQLNDLFSDVLQKMNEHGYSQMPVLDGVRVINVIDASMILKYLYSHLSDDSFIKLEAVRIKDVLDFNRTHHFELIYDTQSIPDVLAIFQNNQEQGNDIRALVVLNHESKTKGPVGIITVKDIPMLLSKLQ